MLGCGGCDLFAGGDGDDALVCYSVCSRFGGYVLFAGRAGGDALCAALIGVGIGRAKSARGRGDTLCATLYAGGCGGI